jgi:hypothetical protein
MVCQHVKTLSFQKEAKIPDGHRSLSTPRAVHMLSLGFHAGAFVLPLETFHDIILVLFLGL